MGAGMAGGLVRELMWWAWRRRAGGRLRRGIERSRGDFVGLRVVFGAMTIGIER